MKAIIFISNGWWFERQRIYKREREKKTTIFLSYDKKQSFCYRSFLSEMIDDQSISYFISPPFSAPLIIFTINFESHA